MYAASLRRRIAQTESRLCAGFDPDMVIQRIDDADGLKHWSVSLIETLHDIVPVFKFQYAYYEAFGPGGLAILKDAIDYSRHLGAIVILDVKRGDIESTLLEYVRTAFPVSDGPRFTWDANAITINPYLGLESIPTILRSLSGTSYGVYLVLTPTAGHKDRLSENLKYQLEHSTRLIADTAAKWIGEMSMGDSRPFLGFVVSALEPQLVDYFSQSYEVPLLIPGVGYQGGDLANIKQFVARNPLNLFSVSRGLYPNKIFCGNQTWASEVRKLALDLRKRSA